MKIEEILLLGDADKIIEYLKKRRTSAPDTQTNLNDWNVDKHEIMTDKEKYPDRKVLVKQEEDVWDESSKRTLHKEPEYDTEPANRIGIPLEQDIINIQTAFTVGTEPKMKCDPSNDDEKNLLKAVTSVLSKNKIKYQNKKIIRAWLAEQEVAEYWYAVDDDSFWDKFWSKVKKIFTGKTKPNKRLRSVIWSPFRGDSLYPFFDGYGDLVAVSREYKRSDLEGKEITCFQTVTKDSVYQWESESGWKLIKEKSFKHGFEKMPILYAYRDKPYCHKIKTLRIRIEKLLSNYADCIDYHFFPILKLFGDVGGVSGKKKDRIVRLEGQGADAQYLTWNQVPTTIELELNTLFNNAYSMTGTPRISFDNLKGTGNALSGVSFEYVFLSTHLQVENHAEDIGDFLQRRVNFLVSALGTINSYEFAGASKTIDIDVEIVPFKIENIDDKVNTAVNAISGGVWSRKQGVIFAGLTDEIEEELALIEEEAKE